MLILKNNSIYCIQKRQSNCMSWQCAVEDHQIKALPKLQLVSQEDTQGTAVSVRAPAEWPGLDSTPQLYMHRWDIRNPNHSENQEFEISQDFYLSRSVSDRYISKWVTFFSPNESLEKRTFVVKIKIPTNIHYSYKIRLPLEFKNANKASI